ncbi:type II secretion system F family protein [Zavarzinella formosa]|uniref:type II secretion system F family protein n=1 Tax=Zavarzinella formosa TaxID=360055 RepID=UPI00030A00DC|nr:type II secretion system F family protein [Zavarzinella formosa]
MIPLFAFSITELTPIIVFGAIVVGAWALMTVLSKRSNIAVDRLDRLSRPQSAGNMDDMDDRRQRFSGLKDAIAQIGGAMEGQSDLEKNKLKLKLVNGGFRSDNAPMIYQGLRVLSLAIFLIPSAGVMLYTSGFTQKALIYIVICGSLGFYLPQVTLHLIVSGRQKKIFLSMPDALDLLVVCVESGLGLDAAMRKITEEMGEHAKTISEEFELANMQLQMGRPRREVLHELGVRTGVDDMKALAAILIQADRFGSSIAQALRVQSDSMRTRRRQIAEEKAAKTAVQLIFPLVLFIFPAIFVVLVGPASIQISKGLLKGG